MKLVIKNWVKAGDVVYDETSEKFVRVVATHAVQGSGPNPDRSWIAYEGNPRIVEIGEGHRFIVRLDGEISTPETNPTVELPIVDEPTATPAVKYDVIVQEWEETERGWGIRPDGFTLHLTLEDHKEWCNAHVASLPTDHVPDEYTWVSGKPQKIAVDKETYDNLCVAKAKGRFGIFVDKVEHKDLRSL